MRLVKEISKRYLLTKENRISLLKKLGDVGPYLHAAPTYDLRPGYNVQGYAYKLFKSELYKLSEKEQAELALHWAQQNPKWSSSFRPFTKKHLMFPWKMAELAKKAANSAEGAKAVGIELRKNPICSIQTAIQRTTVEVFSYPNTGLLLPTERAEATIRMAPYYREWIDVISTFTPEMRAKAREDLEKAFDLDSYPPEHREEVERAIWYPSLKLRTQMEHLKSLGTL